MPQIFWKKQACLNVDSPLNPNKKLTQGKVTLSQIQKDIEDSLGNLDLTSLLQLELLVNSSRSLALIIGML